MPKKAKYTQEQIIDVALDMVEKKGIEILSARSLGKELGCSSRPLFTAFNNMNEIYELVFKKAKDKYDNIIKETIKGPLGFKGVGMEYINFAITYPNLFKLLFSHNSKEALNYDETLKNIESNYNDILKCVEESSINDKEKARELYTQMWIYTHGIATLCSEKVCVFSKEEISNMLTKVYKGLLHEIKGEEK